MTVDPSHMFMLASLLLVAGAVAGVTAGLLGVGGGIVLVPVLWNLFTGLGVDESIRMHIAVGTSLATIIATSASSVRAHHHRGPSTPRCCEAGDPGSSSASSAERFSPATRVVRC